MSEFWFTLSLGFALGFAYRVWGERGAARHDPPAWIVRLGYSLNEQFASVDDGHRFAGDEITVTSQKFYTGTGRRFVVKVEREVEVDA